MDEFVADLRIALRTLNRAPGLALVCILALALGIGATTAIFSLANAYLVRPLPYPEPDRIVVVSERSPSGDTAPVTAANFLDWQSRSRSFMAIAAVVSDRADMGGEGKPEKVQAIRASSALFDVLGVGTKPGRAFLPSEDLPGGPPVVVLSHGAWLRRFGGDQAIVGRAVRLDGATATVVGILPADFRFVRPFEVVLPLGLDHSTASRDPRGLLVLGRLKQQVSVTQADGEMRNHYCPAIA